MLFAAGVDATAQPTGVAWFLSQAFGSDETISYTAEYTWNANQVAHFMMGFVLATVWIRLAVSRWERHQTHLKNNPPAPGSPGPNLFQRAIHSLDFSVGFLFFLIGLKDIVDYLMDRVAFAGCPVPPDYAAVAFDSITDVTFWYAGMFAGAIVIGGVYRKEVRSPARIIIPIVGLALCVIFVFAWAAPIWLEQKRSFDQSGLPFNYTRLPRQALEDREAKNANKKTILSDYQQWEEVLNEYRKRAAGETRPTAGHYLILGGTPEQRSKVAVGMACEFTLALRGATRWETAWQKIQAEEPNADEQDKRKEFEPLRLRRVKYVSAPAVMERPEAFVEDLHRKVVECVVVDDLDTAMRLPEPTTAASKQLLNRINKPVRLSPETAKRLKLGGDFRQQANSEPPPSPVPNLDGTTDSQTALEMRRVKFELLGGLVRTSDVSTIWVLTGDREVSRWPGNREHWIGEIVKLLTVEASPERDAMKKRTDELREKLQQNVSRESGVIVWPLLPLGSGS